MSFGGQPKTSSTLFATFSGTSVLSDSYRAAAKGGWKHVGLYCQKFWRILVNRSFSLRKCGEWIPRPPFLSCSCGYLITKKSLFTQLGRKFTVYIGLLIFFRDKNVKQEEIYNMLMVLGEIRFRDSRRHDTVASRFSTKIPSIVQQKIKDRPTG
jgi:hypothetical protein